MKINTTEELESDTKELEKWSSSSATIFEKDKDTVATSEIGFTTSVDIRLIQILDYIVKMPFLRQLYLKIMGKSITQSFDTQLPLRVSFITESLEQLESFQLVFENVQNVEMGYLTTLLSSLFPYVTGLNYRDTCLKQLSRNFKLFSRLKAIGIESGLHIDQLIDKVGALESLRCLSVYSQDVSDKDVMKVIKAKPQIEEVHTTNYHRFGTESLLHIKRLRFLSIHYSQTPLPKLCVESPFAFNTLEKLDLTWLQCLDDSFFTFLARNYPTFPLLTRLCVKHCPLITDNGLGVFLAQHGRKLTLLHLEALPKLTSVTLTIVKMKCIALQLQESRNTCLILKYMGAMFPCGEFNSDMVVTILQDY
jgi:hypothetical protein